MKTALTIAGTDPSGGAGIQADIKTMTANGVFATCAVTALVAQNTTGVKSIVECTPDFLAEELDCVFTDIFPDAVKTGMVSSIPLIRVIAAKLKEYGAKNLVVDPVMGDHGRPYRTITPQMRSRLGELVRVADIITPNLTEACMLLKIPYFNEGLSRAQAKSLLVRLSELGPNADELLSKVEHIQILACGTSYNSGMVSRYWFESLAGIPCDVEIASEFRYRKSAVRRNSLMITLSQSGETADTLAGLRLSKELGYLGSLAICNVPGSSLVRESDLALMTNAGTEIGVASTKAFTTQLTVLLMLVAKLSRLKGLDASIEHDIVHGLQALPSRIEQMLSQDKRIEALAEDFSDKHHALFLGRGDQYPIALEGALKLKEISYIHAEAYAAGELKHGPLALIDADMPVIVVAPNNELLEKLKSNIEEVRARGGQLYVFADQDAGFVSSDNMHIIEMPHVEEVIAPIFYTVPLQLLAYHVALIKGTDVDQPRNLAKSVTVE